MMDKAIKEKWIAALRSGEYKQGRNNLKMTEPEGNTCVHCCLGVLAELCGIKSETQCGTKAWLFIFSDNVAMEESLSAKLLDTIGLSPRQEEDLIELNDGKGASFAEIADYIEENL
jgi:hypothetical protein